MLYLKEFKLASAEDEVDYILSKELTKLDMQCYSGNPYPFKLFPDKGLERLCFDTVTVLYGGNGSGKSTVLNVIAEKLRIARTAPFNYTPYFEEYLRMCRYELAFGTSETPRLSKHISSDDVFDFLLDMRSINEGIGHRREELFEEYARYTDPTQPSFRMTSLDDYNELKRRNRARHQTKSAYTSAHLPRELEWRSNGESAFAYFTQEIRENALYLLDEPENSLSAKLQIQLATFIEESARFYNCQFIISTHSPFLLAMKGAKIYDLDSSPVSVRKWTELENVRIFRDFFERHRGEFD